MRVNPDQPKQVVDRRITFKNDLLSIELVTFAIGNGKAYGCRVFSDVQSVITDLYDNETEAIKEAGRTHVQI